jgi:flavin reductase (DIM6/NTAB) family NADH-FMN oxidoreductase RutF
MIIDFETISANSRYHLLTQTVMPRPIAWVLSQNEDDSLNLAPFSFFNAMCSDPPLMVLSVGKKPDGEIKDTRRNLISGRDFVIHIAGQNSAAAINASAAVLDYGVSEVEAGNLTLADFPNCPVPRLASCDVAFHCRLFDVHEIGPKQQAMIYAEIVQLFLSDTVADFDGNRYRVDAAKVNPLIRLGGAQYAEFGKVFSLKRPD